MMNTNFFYAVLTWAAATIIPFFSKFGSLENNWVFGLSVVVWTFVYVNIIRRAQKIKFWTKLYGGYTLWSSTLGFFHGAILLPLCFILGFYFDGGFFKSHDTLYGYFSDEVMYTAWTDRLSSLFFLQVHAGIIAYFLKDFHCLENVEPYLVIHHLSSTLGICLYIFFPAMSGAGALAATILEMGSGIYNLSIANNHIQPFKCTYQFCMACSNAIAVYIAYHVQQNENIPMSLRICHSLIAVILVVIRTAGIVLSFMENSSPDIVEVKPLSAQMHSAQKQPMIDVTAIKMTDDEFVKLRGTSPSLKGPILSQDRLTGNLNMHTQ